MHGTQNCLCQKKLFCISLYLDDCIMSFFYITNTTSINIYKHIVKLAELQYACTANLKYGHYCIGFWFNLSVCNFAIIQNDKLHTLQTFYLLFIIYPIVVRLIIITKTLPAFFRRILRQQCTERTWNMNLMRHTLRILKIRLSGIYFSKIPSREGGHMTWGKNEIGGHIFFLFFFRASKKVIFS